MSAADQTALSVFVRGIRTRVPQWLLILEAAKHDPLRAQEIEERVSERWWRRWLAWQDAFSKEQNRQAQKNRKR